MKNETLITGTYNELVEHYKSLNIKKSKEECEDLGFFEENGQMEWVSTNKKISNDVFEQLKEISERTPQKFGTISYCQKKGNSAISFNDIVHIEHREVYKKQNPKFEKYSTIITTDGPKTHVSIIDRVGGYLCEMTFRKQPLEQLGNRYYRDGFISEDCEQVENIFATILMKVQEKYGLTNNPKVGQQADFDNRLGG